MATAPAVPDNVVEFLGERKTLTLATAAGGAPHATTLVYVNDGAVLYIWLRASAATTGQLDQNKQVGFAIDEYADDWRQTKGVQGTGECEALGQGDELARVADLFGQKYPDLRPGATSVVTFYRIVPKDLHFIDNTAGSGDPDPDEYRRESVLGESG